MNKFATSLGVIALSASGLHAAYSPGLTAAEKAKPWSISASLRGFYDDNYVTAPKDQARDSWGFEVSPSASLNLPFEQSFLGLSYVYSAKYYADRDEDEFDHTHQFNGRFDHAFSERYKLELSDSFVLSQEPEIIDSDGIITTPLRIEGDNIRNIGTAEFTAQMTPLLGLQLRYGNTLYDYEDEGYVNSRSALLDRMEHLPSANIRWQVLRQTVGIVGYSFELIDYTADDPFTVFEPLFLGPIAIPFAREVDPTVRNRRSHMFYIGADQNFTSKLNGSIRVGGIYSQFYNISELNRYLAFSEVGELDAIGPYADAALTYTYGAGSYVQVGLRHSRNPTDLIASGTAFVTDQESTSFYAGLTHRLTSRITGNLLGQYQHSTTEGFFLPDDEITSLGDDNFFIIGLNLAYRINPFWTAEAGYDFNRLDSDMMGRSYTRNRVYVGIRATY
jgi:hypothetical protein